MGREGIDLHPLYIGRSLVINVHTKSIASRAGKPHGVHCTSAGQAQRRTWKRRSNRILNILEAHKVSAR
jgi:hypothetical protein